MGLEVWGLQAPNLAQLQACLCSMHDYFVITIVGFALDFIGALVCLLLIGLQPLWAKCKFHLKSQAVGRYCCCYHTCSKILAKKIKINQKKEIKKGLMRVCQNYDILDIGVLVLSIIPFTRFNRSYSQGAIRYLVKLQGLISSSVKPQGR